MKELHEARKYLEQFYKSLKNIESINYLSKGLDLLERIRLEGFSLEDKKVAENIYENLINRIFAQIENVLNSESAELDEVGYWKEVMEIVGPERDDVASKIKELNQKYHSVYVRGFTLDELEELLKRVKEKIKEKRG